MFISVEFLSIVPIDNAAGLQNGGSTSPAAPTKAVGRLRVEIEHSSSDGGKSAKAAVLILNRGRPLRLGGISLPKARPGWFSMELRWQEVWAAALRCLSPEQRERVESPAVFDYLRVELGTRFLRRGGRV